MEPSPLAPDALTVPTISAFELLLVFAGALALLSALRVLRTLVARWPMPSDRRERWQRAEPVVEAVTWLLYLVSATAWLLHEAPLLRLGVLGCLALALTVALWFWVRDYLGGLVLRAEGSVSVGDHVRVGTLDGVVRAMGARGLELDLPRGERAVLGYRVLREATVVRPHGEALAQSATFVVPLPEAVPMPALFEAVDRTLTLHGWVPPAEVPRLARVAGGLEVSVGVLVRGRDDEVVAAVRRALARLGGAPSDA